jgi:hypothetical protein
MKGKKLIIVGSVARLVCLVVPAQSVCTVGSKTSSLNGPPYPMPSQIIGH